MIGLALGLAIWSATSMCVGWATGKWGLLGTPKDSITHENLNYVGISLALLSLVLFFLVKPSSEVKDVEVNSTAAGKLKIIFHTFSVFEGMYFR